MVAWGDKRMKQKMYINKNVYEATMERLDFVFSEFDNIYVAFSGGKDSGVLWNLTLKYMAEHNITRKIGLFYKDFEAQYSLTNEYVEKVFNTAPDFVAKYWICLPFKKSNNLSSYAPLWYTWDDEKQDLWVRPMPKHPYVYNLENNPFEFYKYKMSNKEFRVQFLNWYKKQNGGGKTIALLGICTDESLNRYRAITSKVKMYKNEAWTTYVSKDCYYGYPIYDWNVADIWIANGRLVFEYNKIYDLMYKAGIPLSEQRVATPFLSEGHDNLKLYKTLDPEMWEKLIKRVSGVNFGAIYGDTEGMAYHSIKLPKGHTWKSYAEFLILTLPKSIEKRYKKALELCQEEENYRLLCRSILRCDDERFGNFGATKKIENNQQEKKAEKKKRYADIMKGLN